MIIDTYALKNEATTIVTDDGEGNVVFTNIAVDGSSFTESDPTVPAWAKAETKPGYTPVEIGAAPAYTYGTEDMEDGVSSLAKGTLYLVY